MVLLFLKKFLIGGWLLYSVVLVSVPQTWISCKYTYVPSLLRLPLTPLPPLCRHRAAGWTPCVPQQPPLAGCFTHGGVHVPMLLSQFVHPLPLPLRPQVHSLHLHLCSCPANRFIGTIFHVLIFKVLVQIPGPVVILLQAFISFYSSSHPLGPIFFQRRKLRLRLEKPEVTQLVD